MRIALSTLAAYSGGIPYAMAHAPDGQASGSGTPPWSFDPWVLVPIAIATALYVVGIRRLHERAKPNPRWLYRKAALFAVGWILLAAALVSPVDALGGHLFSAHMVQHELLMLFAGPSLVLASPAPVFAWGIPASLRRSTMTLLSGMRRLWCFLARPLPAWLLHAVTLWVWHIPFLFTASLESDAVHSLQHMSFLIAAILFWQSLLGRSPDHGIAVLSVFGTAVHSSLLGALLTVSPTVWYSPYFETTARWGLSPLEDQQLGGLIMWVPGCVVYLIATIYLAMRWLDRSKLQVERREAIVRSKEKAIEY